LYKQYESVQLEHKETWKAFKRRIKKVIHYKDGGLISESHPDEISAYEENVQFVESI
jgi:hypothetical protein